MDATRQAVLQLNASFEPTSFCSARRALALVVKNKALIVEVTGREVRPGMPYPSVIRLREYVHVPFKQQTLSRKNILLRDRNICQYCGAKFHPSVLTLDHIIPKSKGGKNSFENLVSCCSPCNKKKADKTLDESGMTLLHKPKASNIHTSRFIMRCMGSDDPKWKRFLYHESDDSFVTRQ